MDIAKSYNEIPYKSEAFVHCQPLRLYTLGKMKGLSPPDLKNATILEIGCAFGGNLIPNAIQFPNSFSIGIDISDNHIKKGKELIKKIGLNNVNLIHSDVSNFHLTK